MSATNATPRRIVEGLDGAHTLLREWLKIEVSRTYGLVKPQEVPVRLSAVSPLGHSFTLSTLAHCTSDGETVPKLIQSILTVAADDCRRTTETWSTERTCYAVSYLSPLGESGRRFALWPREHHTSCPVILGSRASCTCDATEGA